MVAPKPFKWVCPKCGYSKVVTQKSDALDPSAFMNRCPKCTSEMEKNRDIGVLDLLKEFLTK